MRITKKQLKRIIKETVQENKSFLLSAPENEFQKMKVTKEHLQQIIKEETEAVIKEGFFSKLGSKVGMKSEKTQEALDNYKVKLEAAVKHAKRVSEDPEDDYQAEKYFKFKKGLDMSKVQASEAISSHGATKNQRSEYSLLGKKYRRRKNDVFTAAEDALGAIERHRDALAAAKKAEKEAEEAAVRLARGAAKDIEGAQAYKDQEHKRAMQGIQSNRASMKALDSGEYKGDQECYSRCIEGFRKQGDTSERAQKKCAADCMQTTGTGGTTYGAYRENKNITKQRLKQIIKEETEAVIKEGFLSKLGSKVGVESGKTRGALAGFAAALEEGELLAKKVIDASGDPMGGASAEQDRAIRKYLKSKTNILSYRATAATAMAKHGATSSQRAEYEEFQAEMDEPQGVYRMRSRKADEIIETNERHAAALAAAKKKEEEERRRIQAIEQNIKQTARAKKDYEKDQRRSDREEHAAAAALDPGEYTGDKECYSRCIERLGEKYQEKCAQQCKQTSGGKAGRMYE
jgi:hypothetical protein